MTFRLTQGAALTAALDLVRKLADPHGCVYATQDACRTHHGTADGDLCPHVVARHLLILMDKEPHAQQYTDETLLAVMRGLVVGQEARVQVVVNGQQHNGSLLTRPGHLDNSGMFRVELDCCVDIDPVNPADIVSLDVAFTGKLGRDLTPEVIDSLKEQIEAAEGRGGECPS